MKSTLLLITLAVTSTALAQSPIQLATSTSSSVTKTSFETSYRAVTSTLTAENLPIEESKAAVLLPYTPVDSKGAWITTHTKPATLLPYTPVDPKGTNWVMPHITHPPPTRNGHAYPLVTLIPLKDASDCDLYHGWEAYADIDYWFCDHIGNCGRWDGMTGTGQLYERPFDKDGNLCPLSSFPGKREVAAPTTTKKLNPSKTDSVMPHNTYPPGLGTVTLDEMTPCDLGWSQDGEEIASWFCEQKGKCHVGLEGVVSYGSSCTLSKFSARVEAALSITMPATTATASGKAEAQTTST